MLRIGKFDFSLAAQRPRSSPNAGGVLATQAVVRTTGDSTFFRGLCFSFHSLFFHSLSTKIFALAETRETTQSAWIDGWMAWITAATGQGTSDRSTVKSTRT